MISGGDELRAAERLLHHELGVTTPDEIDVEAIAFYLDITVKRESLRGCDARLVGVGDQGVVTVTTSNPPCRQRFSIGHELGHWHHHRGQSFECRTSDEGQPTAGKREVERVADAYAADLLMPRYLFRPDAAALRRCGFDYVRELDNDFKTSFIATAIRVVDVDAIPAMLVCHAVGGRRWFKQSSRVPARWFPKDVLDASSTAMDVLHGGSRQARPQPIKAAAWFVGWEAQKYEIREHSVAIGAGQIVTLLMFEEAEMLCRRDSGLRFG